MLSTHAVLLDTAHDALGKKLHTVRRGYYWDPFVQHFAHDETVVNSPLMNHGQWLRVKSLEYAIAQFAHSHAPNPVQILNIGAGLDTLFFRWASRHKLDPVDAPLTNISRVVETDLPEMVAHKRDRIARSKALQEVLLQAPDAYHLVAADLTDPDAFLAAVQANLNPALPTFIVAEFVFVYFPEAVTSKLLSRLLAESFKNNDDVTLFQFDAISPNTRFGHVMVENLAARGIILAGINDLPSTASHEQRLLKVGFKSAHCQTLGQLHKTVPLAQLKELNRIEMVDDWDEWEVVMGHYCVATASKREGPSALPTIFVGLPATHVAEHPATHQERRASLPPHS